MGNLTMLENITTHGRHVRVNGALHIEESNGKRLGKGQMLDIVTLGTYHSSDIHKFVAPTYGEVNYQYRMSLAGWNFGKKK